MAMAVSRPSRLPHPRTVSAAAFLDDSGTGTSGSNSSNTSAVSSSSSSSNSLKDKIRRFFHIPGSKSRIPRLATEHGCDFVRKDAALEVEDKKDSVKNDKKSPNRVHFKDISNDKTILSKKEKKESAINSKEKRKKYRKADDKFVPHHKTRFHQKNWDKQVSVTMVTSM
jgi:hypothetical protein